MRIAISNIAWETSDDELVASFLKKHDIDAIDIAPGKYFPEPGRASSEEISRVRDWWKSRGFDITGMQSLLFGTSGLNLFGSDDIRSAMLDRLAAVCRIAAGLGATRLVFGSPKNRDRSGLTDQETQTAAVGFFRRLGDIAARHGVLVCLEPNPVCYGANFMTSSEETACIVSEVAHPAIRMQLDTGAMTINGEDAAWAIRKYSPLFGHIHASEPNLVTLGDGGTDHSGVASAIRERLPGLVVSIEMLPSKNELNQVAIERALGVAIRHYRDGMATQVADTI